MNVRNYRLQLTCVLFCCVLSGITAARAASAPVTLVPVQNWQQVSDSRGNQWMMQPDGVLYYGSNYNQERGMMLQAGGAVRWNSPQQTPDGSTLVFTGSCGNLEVRRAVTFDLALGAARFVDTFENKSGKAVTVAPSMQFFTNYPAGLVRTDQGRTAQGALNKDECAIIVQKHPNSNQSETLIVVGAVGSKVKPSIMATQNSNSFSLQWNLALKPSARASIMTTVAIRPGAASMQPKALKNEIKPFISPKWQADLPKDLRVTLLNTRSGSRFESDGHSLDPETLGLERGEADQLALGEGTNLKGTAACAELKIETDFGTATIQSEKLAALTGAAFTGGMTRAYLRDGQVIAGKAKAKGLSFTSRTGISLPVVPENLDRIVFHVQPDDGKPGEQTRLYLQTFEGGRLALSGGDKTTLQLLSTWGPCTVSLTDILRLEAFNAEMTGYRIATRDGSTYFCYLSPAELLVETVLFGPQKIVPARIRSLVAAEAQKQAETEDKKEFSDLPKIPYLRLVGDSVLCGTIDCATIRLRSGSNIINLPPEQIRSLVNEEAGEEEGGQPVFVGELWGSGAVAGEIVDFTLPVRTAHGLLQVPVRDIVEIAVPTPKVPDSMRQRIAELIKKLGDDQWNVRDKASEELAELGIMARQQLIEQKSQTSDEEISWRIQKLLDGMGD